MRISIKRLYLAAAAEGGPPAAEGVFGQGDVLDDLGKVQVDLQQQALAPLTHRTDRRRIKHAAND